jgi:diguanylate cyclase (GGDEF)-like protein/PAS domain S-box-containing protein
MTTPPAGSGAFDEDGVSDRALLDALHVGVVIHDAHGRVVKVNRAAASLLGVTDDQLMGVTSFDPEWTAVYEDGSPCDPERHPLTVARLTREPVAGVVLGVTSSTLREPAWLLVSAEPILDASGDVVQVVASFTDVRAHRAARMALAEREARLHSVEDAAQDAIMTIDEHGTILTANRAAELMYGYGEGELAGVPIRNLSPMEQRQVIDRAYEGIRAGKDVLSGRESFEMTRLRRDGTPVPVEMTIRIERIDGRAIITNVSHDISRRKYAEQQLRESKERFQSLVEHSADLLSEFDAEGRFTYVSPNHRDILGYEPAELLGELASTFVHPEDIDALRQQVRVAVGGEGESGEVRVRFRRKDGSWRWLEASASGHRTRGDAMIVTVARDVTERVETENALAASERLFRQLADGAPILVYMTDQRFRAVFANRAMLEFTGRTLEEQLAVPLGENQHPDDAASLRAVSQPAIRRRMKFSGEAWFRNAAGEYRWLITAAVPRYDHAGNYAGYIGYSVDITERREAEDALRESEERLRGALTAEHERSRRDPLTNALNHGAIAEELKCLVATGSDGPQAAVIMVDVDGMKAVNDTFGHPVGDVLLQAVGAALGHASAVVGRYGGDEFVAILPGAGRQQAEQYRDDVAQRLASVDLRDPETGARVVVAASIGVAIYPTESVQVEELVTLADNEMYASKRERTLDTASAAGQRAVAADRAARIVGELVPLLAHGGTLDEKLQLASRHLSVGAGYEAVTFDVFDEGKAQVRDENTTIGTNAFVDAPQEAIEKWRQEQREVVGHPIGAILERTQRPVIMDDIASNELLTPGQRELLASIGIRSGIAVPLLWQGEMIGTMSVGSRSAGAFGARDGQFLTAVATHVSAIIRMERMVAHLQMATDRLAGARDDTVTLLAASVETHDPTTGLHLRNVRALTESLAREMGYAPGDAEQLGIAAVLHDVGKIRVPDAILTGSGRLTEEEWLVMKQHAVWGAEFLAERPGFELASVVARAHHERWDGTGYPSGLAGADIPEAATIVAVADAFDAITSARTYREPRPMTVAAREIARGSGAQFNPAVVAAFLRLYRRRALPVREAEDIDAARAA